MNRDEALAEAVIGERVRAVDMPEGVYIDYQFNGWRINFPNGSSSGYGFKEHDKTVEWEVYVKPAPVGWDMALVKPPEPLYIQQAGRAKRRGRSAWVPPAEINDIDDAKPCAHETRRLHYTADGVEVDTCLDCGKPISIGPVPWPDAKPEQTWDNVFADKAKVEGGWMDKPKPVNPWADAGLTSEPKPANCWPALNKGTSQ